MRKFIATLAMALCLLQLPALAQKQSKTYNLEKAIEILGSKNPNEQEALSLLDKQLQITPNSADALYLRGAIYHRNDDEKMAIKNLTEALRCYSKRNTMTYLYRIYWFRACAYAEIGDIDACLADYGQAISAIKREDKNNRRILGDILSDRAGIYYDLEQYDLSDADYLEMRSLDAMEQVPMIGLARNMIARENFTAAVEMLDNCAKIDDSYEEIYHYRLLANEGLGRNDAAIDDAVRYVGESDDPDLEIIERVMRRHLTYAVAKLSEKVNNDKDKKPLWVYMRALANGWKGDYGKVIKDYANLIEEFGYNGDLCSSLADAYDAVGLGRKAIAEISRVIEAEGAGVRSLDRRGRYYSNMGDYENAIKDFEHIIEIAPTIAYGYYRTGFCHELSGDDATAMKYYDEGIDIDQSYAYIYLMRGELLLKQGREDEAIKDFERVVQLDTVLQSGSCRQYALHFLGKDDEALDWMDKLIENDPSHSGHYYDKTCLLCRMGHIEDALVAFEKCLSMGYSHFGHIEHDDDLDPIRENPKFKELMAEFRGRIAREIEAQESEEFQPVISEVALKRRAGGTYEIACNINDLPLNLIFDTGASDVTISSVEANFMLKNGYLKDSDIKGKRYYQIASGEIKPGTVITLREVKIGDAVLKNVDASVVDNQKAPLLLGQSVLERFGIITIDNVNSKLIIKSK